MPTHQDATLNIPHKLLLLCMKKKILITGASGFIGSTVVDKALSLGYDVWAGIRSSSSKEYLQDSRIRFIDLQYADKEKLKAQLQDFANRNGKFDYIVHLAGITKTIDKADFDNINFCQLRNFTEALIETDSVPSLFVFMSTLGVMGIGDETGYTPLQVGATPTPNTAYGKSKLKAENYIKDLYDFPYLILRPTGVYGPRDKDYLILMRAIKSGLSVGAGLKKQLLSFIYVEDLADIIFLSIDKGITQKEYYVSDGYGYTDTEFNNLVQKHLNKKRVLEFKIPLFFVQIAAYINEKVANLINKPTTFNTDKYWIMKQRNWTCDISPLQKDINFEPQYLLDKGVEKTIKWYKDNKWL